MEETTRRALLGAGIAASAMVIAEFPAIPVYTGNDPGGVV